MKAFTQLLAFVALIFTMAIMSCNDAATTAGDMQQPKASPAEAGTAADTAAVAGETSETDDEDDDDEGKSGSGNRAGTSVTMDYQNLQEAFKGETTASAKYAAYSQKAMAEGYPEIAMLFKAASASEGIHANNHKAVLVDAGQSVPAVTPAFTVKTTAENLKDAIAGESYEITTMYPAFLKDAQAAGHQLSQISLNYAYKTEQKHKALYEKALAALDGNTVKSLSMTYVICPTCGNTYDGPAPKRCGISMTSADKFKKISAPAS
jgi:rubrerythrin